jgi:DNA-binding transcriptional ArsR family regulator/precorrin-6B methylase 2
MQSLASASDLFGLFAEPTRVRLLRVLAEHELSVAELVTVTDVPQSSVSTHLGKLREAGLVRDRKDGTSTYYTLSPQMSQGARRVWELVSSDVTDAVLASDRTHAAEVLRARRSGFPESIAGEMERHYSPGRTWESLAMSFAGLLRLGRVLDVGAGDGSVAELISPRARAVTCIDSSDGMVDAARKRLGRLDHVTVVKGDMHELPFGDASFDQVLMLNVLVHSSSPGKAISEAARTLARNGDLVIVTLDAHEHDDAASSWGHAQQGIGPANLRRAITRAGLTVERCEVVTRERRAPRFGVVVAYAHKKNKP